MLFILLKYSHFHHFRYQAWSLKFTVSGLELSIDPALNMADDPIMLGTLSENAIFQGK